MALIIIRLNVVTYNALKAKIVYCLALCKVLSV